MSRCAWETSMGKLVWPAGKLSEEVRVHAAEVAEGGAVTAAAAAGVAVLEVEDFARGINHSTWSFGSNLRLVTSRTS